MSAHEPSTHSPLISQIFSAHVLSTHLDHCDFQLHSGERVRLYQSDSLAVDDERLMADIPEYKEKEICQLLITHRRVDEKGGVLYYANERWAAKNPWDSLVLRVGDSIQGTVIAYIYGELDRLKGYHIRLNTNLSINQNPNLADQPDIYVYLPIEELPWSDGDIRATPCSDGINKRLLLELGEEVRAILTEINTLPLYPKCSLLDEIKRNDENFESSAHLVEVIGRLKEQLHKDRIPISEDLGITGEQINPFMLTGLRVLVVDDREDSLNQLKESLERNGADCIIEKINPEENLNHVVNKVLSLIDQENPHLVLIDNALPDQDEGLRLMQSLFAKKNSKKNILF